MAEREPDKQRRDDEGAAKCCGLRPAVVAAAGVATALGALAFSRVRRVGRARGHEVALAQLAEETGCQFTPSEPRNRQGPDFPAMAGTHRGRQVRVETEVSGSPLNYHFHTQATAEHTAPVEGFAIVREETFLTRVADRFGLADIQVGEPAFDDRFEVVSDLDDAARLLQPEVRDALMAARFESFTIRQGEVTVRQEGPVTDLEALRQSLKLAVDVAEWLETLT